MCVHEGTPSPNLSLSNLLQYAFLANTAVIMAILITIIVTSNFLLR